MVGEGIVGVGRRDYGWWARVRLMMWVWLVGKGWLVGEGNSLRAKVSIVVSER